mmetsp:Transcript_513/g.1080  ORF Transcript_513/g.1080 Transcript_513/m.1080 type:complete len:232 (-) Transcript_513:341-1036(-)
MRCQLRAMRTAHAGGVARVRRADTGVAVAACAVVERRLKRADEAVDAALVSQLGEAERIERAVLGGGKAAHVGVERVEVATELRSVRRFEEFADHARWLEVAQRLHVLLDGGIVVALGVEVLAKLVMDLGQNGRFEALRVRERDGRRVEVLSEERFQFGGEVPLLDRRHEPVLQQRHHQRFAAQQPQHRAPRLRVEGDKLILQVVHVHGVLRAATNLLLGCPACILRVGRA